MPLPYCSSIGFVIQKGHILLFVVMYSPVAFHACVLVAGVQVPLRSEERFIRGIQATQKGGLLIFLFYIGFLLHILFDTRVEFQSGAWIPLRSTTTRC
jgi:hypothetical protein